MTHFRLMLMVVLMGAFLCLTGFKKPIHNSHHPTKSQRATRSVEDEAKQMKSLDLSVPARELSFERVPPSASAVEDRSTDALAISGKTKPSIIDVNGHLIMSQEPEAGKIKSADGAGIMINLRH